MTSYSLLAALFLLALSPAIALAGEIKIMSTQSTYVDLLAKVVPAFEKKTGHRVVYVDIPKTTTDDLAAAFKADKAKTIRVEDSDNMTNGKRTSATIMVMHTLVKGNADAVAASSPFSQWKKTYLKQFPAREPDLSKITHRVIGHDLIQIIVNPTTKVTKLNIEQVKKLLTGEIKNWKEVGGADLPVSPVIEVARSARVALMKDVLLGGKEFRSDSLKADTPDEYMELIVKNPGAIGLLPIKELQDDPKASKVVAVQTEPIGRPITLLTVGKPSPEAQELIQFIGQEGKKLSGH